MTNRKRRNTLLAVAAVLVLGLLAAAWIRGGVQPLRPIAEPVALPPLPAGATR